MQDKVVASSWMLDILKRFDLVTAIHCKKVAHLSRSIGIQLCIDDEVLDELSLAGLLHDLGKIAIPIEIISKPIDLSFGEYDAMKLHVAAGVAIAEACGCGDITLNVIRRHHERLDGSGYPAGLSGEEIDQFSRIVAVADVYSAMTSPRPYREALTTEAALAELKNKNKFDADVVRALVSLIALQELQCPAYNRILV